MTGVKGLKTGQQNVWRYSFRCGVRDGRASFRDRAASSAIRQGARMIARYETEDRARRAYFLGFARGVSR